MPSLPGVLLQQARLTVDVVEMHIAALKGCQLTPPLHLVPPSDAPPFCLQDGPGPSAPPPRRRERERERPARSSRTSSTGSLPLLLDAADFKVRRPARPYDLFQVHRSLGALTLDRV